MSSVPAFVLHCAGSSDLSTSPVKPSSGGWNLKLTLEFCSYFFLMQL
uniref:Uncharacterized protein n=1 Tax=Arundo donax TaxID=35708 RepID=A0A0A8ZXR7_ARUDO